MDFKDLLAKQQIDPGHVLVLRHTPTMPKLRTVLGWLAADHPAVFNAYQQTQNDDVEREMKRATHVASFIGNPPGYPDALFVGLYRRNGEEVRNPDQIRAESTIHELERYGVPPETKSRFWFDLQLQEGFYADWKGKMVIRWPGRAINWHRWAHKANFTIRAIHEESRFCKEPTGYKQWDLSWDELKVLPKSWKAKLHEWRGIYLIFDTSDGKAYVGSASGHDNMLGRWQNYADCGHGGNQKLLTRNASDFRFSILELVSPDMDPDAVISREENWKLRLRTRTLTHGLNVPALRY